MTPDAKKKKKKTFSAAVVDNSAARSEKKTTPKVSGAVNAIVRGAKAGAAVTSARSKATGTAKKSTSRRMPVKSRNTSTNTKRDFSPVAMDIGTMSWSDISSARRKREAAKRRDASALRKSALAPLDLTSGSVPDAYRLDTKKSTPTATPAPTVKPKPTATPAPTVKPTPTATTAPTAKPTPTPTVTPNPTAKPAQSAPQPAQDEKISGLLMQFPGGDAKSALDAANEKDAKRRTELHEAAQRGDWKAFSVAGDKYAITRPDDAALLGAEVPSGADMLLGALTPDGFGKNGWQKREQGEMIYANDDGAASVEADVAARGGAFAAPDARKAAMDKTLGMLGVGKMDVVPGMQELPGSAEERRAKAEADKIWRGIEDEYVRSTPEYKAARAELDVQREGYARQLETVDALLTAQTEAGASDDQISDTKRQQRLLKKAIFDTDCETEALTGKVRAQQVDAGMLEGDVTDEERLKYGISPNIESDGSFFGELVANVERARFSGSASVIRKAQKELRGVCQLISNSTAAAKGYDTIYDYAAECSPTERTILMLGFDPSERMDDEEIDFGSEWWNTYQQINELVVDNGSDMAVSMMTGGGNKVLSGIINAALSAPDNFSAAVEEANNYGASAVQAETAGLAEGTVNTVLDMWGYDKISSASKSLFSKVSSPGMRKLLHKGGLVLASHPGANALLNWLTGSVSEGVEEMGEDVVHGLVQRVVYDDTSEWVGEDGIFNLREILTDGALGTAFGGFTTLIGGLGMDKGTHSREYAEEIITDIGFGRDVDGKLTELEEMIEAESRTKERTAQDVEIHAAIWDDTGTERPETYAAWHDAAQEADAAHAQYQMAKRNLEDALTAADLGELNITTPQGVKTFRAAIKQVEKSKAAYKKALAQDENARAKYYEDEDDLRAGMSAKRDALDEAAQRITKAVNTEGDVTNAGRRRAAVDINSPDVVTAARNLRDSVLREVELRGQIDAAHADKDAAAGPMDIVEADRRAEALGAELEEAEQQSAEAETELRRAASSSADLDARMNALRQEAAGKAGYRQEYARMTDSELDERARLLEMQRSRLGKSLVDAHGVKVEEVRTKLKDVGERIEAVTREQEMRREVYGQMEYSVPDAGEMQLDAGEVQTDARPDAQLDAQPDAQPDAQSGGTGRTRIGTKIYRNGQLLFGDMTDDELAMLTAHVAQEAANEANAPVQGDAPGVPDADVGMPDAPEQPTAHERLDALREERRRRAQEIREQGATPQEAARQARMEEIRQTLEDVRAVSDRELAMQRNWLTRRMNTMSAEQDSAEVGQQSHEYEELRGYLDEIRTEETKRRDARREQASEIMHELDGERAIQAEADGRADEETVQAAQDERARIKDVQRDTRARIEADNRRVTDTISLEEAAKTFDTGYTASDLRRNSERLAEWEQRRATLAESIADMDRELKSIEGRRGRAADDESYAADYDGRPAANGDAEVRRENMLRRSLAAQRSAIKQVDRIIRYLDQHSADSVVDTLKSGHIAEPIMEKILGIVDGMHKDRASGLLGMHHSTPERVFDDYFGKASPVMRAIYLDPIHDAETQRTKFIDHCRERINALHLNALESELVQRYGEGLMTPAELAAAIDKKLARRGTKLKDGSGEWTLDKGTSSAARDMDTLSAEGWGDKADEVRRIQHAVAEFRRMYDQVWEMENDALIRNGYEGLGKRRQYFPHFQEKESTWKLIYDKITGKGSSEGENALPTEINGRTAGNSPSKVYDPHAKRRETTQTTYDAIKGFEDYIDRSTKVAYHTDNIKRLRQLENSIRAGYKNSMLSGNKIGANFVIWLHEYSNLLANKHSNLLLDRSSEATGGRIFYQLADSMRSRRGAAAVAGNVGAALSDVAPVVQVMAEHPVSTVKGLMGWIMELNGGSSIPESGFMQRRQASGAMDVTNMGKVANAISKPFEFIDALATNIVVRANYYANLDAGMAPTDAMRSADAQSARLMADRSWGAMPNFYNNKTFMAVLGQFQLEVANTASWLGKDVIRTHGGMRAAGVYALSAVLYHLVNKLFEEKLTGNSLLPDPIGAVKEGIEVGQRDGIWEGILAGSRELADGLPYMGNGRIGTGIFDGLSDFINSGIKAVQTNDPADWNNLFWYATNYITYGGQFKKIYQGVGALMQDGVYNRNGQLMYPIDTSDDWTKVQTVLFGKNSTAYARQYWDEGRQALSEDNTSLYERAVQEGMSPAEAYEHMYSYQAAKTANSEYKKLLAAGDIEGAQKALIERNTQMQGANYDMLVPDDMRGGVMPQKTMDMLEMAWREDMDSKWLPGSSSTKYNGSFKKDGVERKFTESSMEILQRVAQKELAARLERYADEWPQMTNEERTAALKVCTSGKTEGGDKIWPSSVWVAAKEYGLENGLKYTTSDEYKAAHEGDEETVYTNPEKGLTNPIQDAIGWVRDKLGFGDGEQQSAAVLPETQVQPDAATDADILPEYEPQQPGSGRKSSGGRGGRSGGRRGGSRGHGSGMTVGIPGATVTIPWHRTRLGEAFGAGYDPVKSGLISPLSNSFTLGGANYTLSDEQMTQYTGVYDAYMDMYLRERQADWDAADAAGREQIYREVDERARAAAQQHWAELR